MMKTKEERKKEFEANPFVPIKGETTLKNVPFAYEISVRKKAEIARKGCKYLKIKIFHRNMTYQGIGMFKIEDLKEPARFYLCCDDMIKRILRANPFLVEALAYEHDKEE